MLRSIFGKKKKERLPDSFVNPIKVDLHSHYLPGIDDGCKEIGESLAILKKLEEKGFRKAITTPHIMWDYYKNTPEIIADKLAELRQAMKHEGIGIELEAAAEYYVDEWFEKKILDKDILYFGDKYVLIETGFIDAPHNLINVIFELKTSGYKPVLAHPERYQYFTPDSDMYNKLVNSGVFFQLNLLSIIGYYSPQVKKVADHLIEHKMVNFIGGDVHNMKHLFIVQEEAMKSRIYGKLVELPLLNNTL